MVDTLRRCARILLVVRSRLFDFPSRVSVVISKTGAGGRSRPAARNFYISHSMHPNDLVYTENPHRILSARRNRRRSDSFDFKRVEAGIDALLE